MKWHDHTQPNYAHLKLTLYPLFILVYSNKHELVFLYLEGGGSNAKQERKEEEEDEGDGCVSHVVFLHIHSAVPVVVCFEWQKLWIYYKVKST